MRSYNIPLIILLKKKNTKAHEPQTLLLPWHDVASYLAELVKKGVTNLDNIWPFPAGPSAGVGGHYSKPLKGH